MKNQAELRRQIRKLLREEGNLLKEQPRRIKVSRRQIHLLLKEMSNDSDELILTEAELNEVAPIITAIARGAATAAARGAAAAARGVTALATNLGRGAVQVGKSVAKGASNVGSSVTKLLRKASPKMPNLSKHLDTISLDLDKPDMVKLADLMQNPPKKARGELDKMLKTASNDIKKAAHCQCPSLEQLEAAVEEEEK